MTRSVTAFPVVIVNTVNRPIAMQGLMSLVTSTLGKVKDMVMRKSGQPKVQVSHRLYVSFLEEVPHCNQNR